MSLQTRLAALISAIGADIKALFAQISALGELAYKSATDLTLNGITTFSKNASAPQPPPVDTIVHIVGEDGKSTRFVLDGYATSSAPNYIYRKARGTAEDPTAVQSGDLISNMANFALSDDGVYYTVAQFMYYAAENMSSAGSTSGGYYEMRVKPMGELPSASLAAFGGVVRFYHAKITPSGGPVSLDSFPTSISGALRGSVIHGDGGRRSL